MLQAQAENNRGHVLRLLSVPLVLGGAVLTLLLMGGSSFGEVYIADAGAVQTATLVILLVSFASAAFLAWRHAENRLNLGLLACGLAIYAGREHDLHRLEFLAEHFTKWQFYTIPAVPLWQKCCFGTLMAFIIGTIGIFLVRMVPRGLEDLKRAEPWTKCAAAWLTMFVASQISDRTWLNKVYSGRAFEETAELTAAGFALLVVWHFPRNQAPQNPSIQIAPREIPREPTPMAKAS